MASKPDLSDHYTKAAGSKGEDALHAAIAAERAQVIEDLKKYPETEYHNAMRTQLILSRALEDATLAQEYAIPDFDEYLDISKSTGKRYVAIFKTFDALEQIADRHQHLIPDVVHVLDKHKNHTMLMANESGEVKKTMERLGEIDGFLKSQPANTAPVLTFEYTS